MQPEDMAQKQKASKLYRVADPRLAPAYSFAEAAHYLRLPVETLRYWSLGRAGTAPVFRLDGTDREHLSFWNVVEGHVLSGICRRHGVKLPAVRRALCYVQEHLGIDRPLIHQSFKTDGRSLFVEKYSQLIDASRQGQIVMDDLLLARLTRIEWDELGLPIRLYPFTRSPEGQCSGADQPKLVMMNPRVSFGRPNVAGVPTSVIWSRYRAGDSTAHLARDYGLTSEQIEEAIRCEAA